MTRALSHKHAHQFSQTPDAEIILDHDGRHLRRKLLTLASGEEILVDFAATTSLIDGDALVLEDNRLVRVTAAKEKLYEVTANSRIALLELAWHLGNRHLAAQIAETCILIKRDHVIHEMLKGLGAKVTEVEDTFSPVRGAYHTTNHSHSHD